MCVSMKGSHKTDSNHFNKTQWFGWFSIIKVCNLSKITLPVDLRYTRKRYDDTLLKTVLDPGGVYSKFNINFINNHSVNNCLKLWLTF